MMSSMEEVFLKYEEHIPDYEEMICLIDLLPSCYQYEFLKRLIQFKEYMKDGDIIKGKKPIGLIKIVGDEIILTGIPEFENDILLVTLPHHWEV